MHPRPRSFTYSSPSAAAQVYTSLLRACFTETSYRLSVERNEKKNERKKASLAEHKISASFRSFDKIWFSFLNGNPFTLGFISQRNRIEQESKQEKKI
jgi:hypothetical protein